MELIRFEARFVESKSTTTSKKGTRCQLTCEIDLDTHNLLMSFGGDLEKKIFAVGISEIHYDTPQSAPESTHKRHIGKSELEAYHLCANKSFQSFCKAGDMGEPFAATYLKVRCGVMHRAEIGNTRESAEAFMRLKKQFGEWEDKKQSKAIGDTK